MVNNESNNYVYKRLTANNYVYGRALNRKHLVSSVYGRALNRTV